MIFLGWMLCLCFPFSTGGFLYQQSSKRRGRWNIGQSSSENEDRIVDTLSLLSSENYERQRLKRDLLQLGASFDRGFGASPSARRKAAEVVKALEELNEETDAARGIAGDAQSPLQGSWRMVWTTAQDVLILGASPIAAVGAIYQDFRLPVVTNIIDFIPRAQALLPNALSRSTLLRAEVKTRASPRPSRSMRVGLDFEAVQLKPLEVFGFSADGVLPPFGFDLPKIDIPGSDPDTAPGYFDVTYLDEELLVIRQNAPGGMFALVKVPENDP